MTLDAVNCETTQDITPSIDMTPFPMNPVIGPDGEQAPTAPPADILKKCIVLSLTIHTPGNSKKVKQSAIKVAEDFTMPKDGKLRISKELFNSPELKAVRKHARAMRDFVQENALMASLKAGMYPIPIKLWDKVDSKIQTDPRHPERGEMYKKFWELVEVFLERYPQRCAEAPEDLGSLYNNYEYPSVAEMRAGFNIDISYHNYGTPETLKEISLAAFRRQEENAKQMWQDEAKNIKDAMRECMLGLVDHIVDCLSVDEKTGKLKTFHDTMKENMMAFLETFPAKNEVIGDTQLADLAEKAKALLADVDPADLRKKNNLDERERVRIGFEQIKSILADNMHVAPSRRLRLDEEDDEVTTEDLKRATPGVQL